jgi:HTH-type transcriptional regulator/antitoxin HipB
MRINSARDLGLQVRERRRDLAMTQAQLAAAAGVSRRWLSDLEAGKPRAEIELVLRTLYALGLTLDMYPTEPPEIDLDEVLRRHTGEP